MVKGAILRQGRQLLFVALTVALGISLATAMLNVMFDVGEKVNQELKAFGANITPLGISLAPSAQISSAQRAHFKRSENQGSCN